MTGTCAACLHTNQSRSYLNHLVIQVYVKSDKVRSPLVNDATIFGLVGKVTTTYMVAVSILVLWLPWLSQLIFGLLWLLWLSELQMFLRFQGYKCYQGHQC
jgi:hypothetical protein